MADTLALGASAHKAWRFDSSPRHQFGHADGAKNGDSADFLRNPCMQCIIISVDYKNI